jgi:two-component system, NtrC family, response regulator HydG
MKNRILIIEDDKDLRELLVEVFEDEEFEVLTAKTGNEARKSILDENEFLDLIVTDIQLPEIKGNELLKLVRENRAETAVIVITAFGSVEQAVELVKQGAFQYITKPFQIKDLINAAISALQSTRQVRAAVRLRRENTEIPSEIIGASRQIRELLDLVNRAGKSNSNILITGESGTGKELVARAVHEASGRKGAFIAINCSAIPAELVESELFGHTGQAFTGAKNARVGLFESANEGTLFLDEIGELPLVVQPKLLRVLQENMIRRIGDNREKPVDVRLITATNRDLESAVSDGSFRDDLYWRLNVIHLHVPPLRERIFDIPLLIEHFLEKYRRDGITLKISAETLAILTGHSWSGNVRELENTLERAVALARGAILTPEDLPERIRNNGANSALLAKAKAGKMTIAELEREYILETLQECGGNKSRTAELLGLDRRTLYRKLDEYEKSN